MATPAMQAAPPPPLQAHLDGHVLWYFAIESELISDWEQNRRVDCLIHTPADPHFMTGFFTGRTRYLFPVFCALVNN
jgi:hypothetical protein